MPDRNREERLQIMLTPDELKLLDDWRFARRMPSRAAAVRELLKRGLSAEGWDIADGSRSTHYGVLGSSPGSGAAGDGRPREGED
ncbi:MAG: hypothetical protein NW200_04855 [Hyphomonadaceae bacterium]|nr:hypothetical protein [Hyphomonadaceae bacterium]